MEKGGETIVSRNVESLSTGYILLFIKFCKLDLIIIKIVKIAMQNFN